MIQERRRHRKGGGRVSITPNTLSKMEYVLVSLKMGRGELGVRLGMCAGTISLILNRRQHATSREIHEIYFPRLMSLASQADLKVGRARVTDPQVTALNPVSTPEAQAFVLEPYKEKLKEETEIAQKVWQEGCCFEQRRQRTSVAMKAYWAKRRAREAKASLIREMDRVEDQALSVQPPVISREGFFKRVYNAIVTGFHAGQ